MIYALIFKEEDGLYLVAIRQQGFVNLSEDMAKGNLVDEVIYEASGDYKKLKKKIKKYSVSKNVEIKIPPPDDLQLMENAFSTQNSEDLKNQISQLEIILADYIKSTLKLFKLRSICQRQVKELNKLAEVLASKQLQIDDLNNFIACEAAVLEENLHESDVQEISEKVAEMRKNAEYFI